MNKVEGFGYLENGVVMIAPAVRKRMAQELKEMPDCDIEYIIKKRGKRSLPSNNYYWGVMIPEIRLELRNRGERMNNDDVHEFLKYHFNKKYIRGEEGEVIGEYGGSTAEMNQDEFGEYLERIIQWCGEKLQLVISPPNTQTQMF